MRERKLTSKSNMCALLAAAREAGWIRARVEIMPDHTIRIDTSMVDRPEIDDFDTSDWKM